MANTRGSSPYSTYHTDRVQLIGNPEQRGSVNSLSGQDQQFINFYPTVIDSPINSSKRYRLEQRGGINGLNQLFGPNFSTLGRGIYYFDNAIFSVMGNGLYKDSLLLKTLSTTTGKVGFVEYATITTRYLVILDGVNGYAVQAGGIVATQITDVDFPTPHCVNATSMDGYVFIAKSGTGDIYNCVLNDPFTWNAGDFISAEMYPDPLVALTRQNNYIVAFGSTSIEYFYDTGVFPGTPLARNAAAGHQIGTPAPNSIVETEEQIIFIGQTGVGGRTIWIMDGFQPTEIGIDPVKKDLNLETLANLAITPTFCVRYGGHRFFVMNLTTVDKTWVYDFDTKMWHQWSSPSGGVGTKFRCNYSTTDSSFGTPLLQDNIGGWQFFLTYGQSYDDISGTRTAITSTATSAKLDFGNLNRKFMHRFSLVCDRPPGATSTACTIYWSDDDYQTWSSGVTIDVNSTLPTLTQLGSFRRRAFKVVYAQNRVAGQATCLLLEGFEVDTNMGSQ